MITTLKIWSEAEQALVDWDVSFEDEVYVLTDTPVAILPDQVITVKYGDKFYKFSPNTTDDELLKRAEEINKEYTK